MGDRGTLKERARYSFVNAHSYAVKVRRGDSTRAIFDLLRQVNSVVREALRPAKQEGFHGILAAFCNCLKHAFAADDVIPLKLDEPDRVEEYVLVFDEDGDLDIGFKSYSEAELTDGLYVDAVAAMMFRRIMRQYSLKQLADESDVAASSLNETGGWVRRLNDCIGSPSRPQPMFMDDAFSKSKLDQKYKDWLDEARLALDPTAATAEIDPKRVLRSFLQACKEVLSKDTLLRELEVIAARADQGPVARLRAMVETVTADCRSNGVGAMLRRGTGIQQASVPSSQSVSAVGWRAPNQRHPERQRDWRQYSTMGEKVLALGDEMAEMVNTLDVSEWSNVGRVFKPNIDFLEASSRQPRAGPFSFRASSVRSRSMQHRKKGKKEGPKASTTGQTKPKRGKPK